MTRLLIAEYLLAAGVLLVFAPWTAYWDRNQFAATMPALAAWMANDYVRGAVSGVGVITALVGLRDLLVLLFVRSPRAPDLPGPPGP